MTLRSMHQTLNQPGLPCLLAAISSVWPLPIAQGRVESGW
jgi:hypothetical protein